MNQIPRLRFEHEKEPNAVNEGFRKELVAKTLGTESGFYLIALVDCLGFNEVSVDLLVKRKGYTCHFVKMCQTVFRV